MKNVETAENGYVNIVLEFKRCFATNGRQKTGKHKIQYHEQRPLFRIEMGLMKVKVLAK